MLSALNPFRPLELRSGIQVYPPPQQASLERRSSLSVFQLCHSVRSRLLGNPAFARYLHSCAQSPIFDPSDPVNHLWDCFCLGISLCYLYNTVSARSSIIPLTVGTDLSMLEAAADQDRAKKVAIVNFAMRARDLNPAWTTLTVTDLVNNRVSLDGFLKVRCVAFCFHHTLT
jgi:cell division control protein 24